MSRMKTIALAGSAVLALGTGLASTAEAAPLPAATSAAVAGAPATLDQVRWRGGYYGGYRGYGYRGYGYRRGAGGALAAGAALGLIGGAIAASAAPRYYDYGYGYPAYGYAAPAYGYAAPAYGYSYGYPAYGYYGY
ncbi:conserved hypothetical protein [Methylobacterium sp. 4-46]|uniref:hypothetical protein n=1 Tax=unclassified Methylobacterium TaxID=2615210 RepID=UPI000152E70F|nr:MULTISPECIES: hypothetical protein [Methylobacterium]ACA20272.1 conserved hypothetical protein [Methylobacterium sp. 4-46]WFT79448.1 hypothetical protein QA634_30250 [Methylobacterium nodulans]